MKNLVIFALGMFVGVGTKVDLSGFLYKDSNCLGDLPKINLYELQYQKSLEIADSRVKIQQLQVELENISKMTQNIFNNLESVKTNVTNL